MILYDCKHKVRWETGSKLFRQSEILNKPFENFLCGSSFSK